MEMQAPETFTSGTLMIVERAITPFDPAVYIVPGMALAKQNELHRAGEDIKFEQGPGRYSLSEDAQLGLTLFEEEGQKTLRSLYDKFRVTWIQFTGLTVTDPFGRRYYPYLYRIPGGEWAWHALRRNDPIVLAGHNPLQLH